MPDTPEHKVAMQHLVRDLLKAGKPSWTYQVHLRKIFWDGDLTFEQKRDAIVSAVRSSKWENEELIPLLEELEDVEDVEAFDVVMDAIYDLADYDRVWLG